MRLLFSFVWSDELDGFYISEIDIFFYCIAVMVALFSEIKNLKKIPYDLGLEVFYGLLMLYIIALFFGVYLSMEFEHHILLLKHRCLESLKSYSSPDEIFESITNIEDKKFHLYLASILAAILTTILSYKTLFKVNG